MKTSRPNPVVVAASLALIELAVELVERDPEVGRAVYGIAIEILEAVGALDDAPTHGEGLHHG